MRTAILRVRGFIVARVERKLLPVAHGAQPIRGDAERHQIRARRHGATLAQCQIVLGGPAFVAVTFNLTVQLA